MVTANLPWAAPHGQLGLLGADLVPKLWLLGHGVAADLLCVRYILSNSFVLLW